MLRVSFAVLLCLGLSACEDKDDDKVFSAQNCNNTATQATVDTCVAMLAGITTNRASILRCSADFIRQDITGDKIAVAIEGLDENSGNNNEDPNVKFLDGFIFTNYSSKTGLQWVDQAVANCQATGSDTLLTLALSAKTATIMKVLAGGSTIEAWLDTNPDGSLLEGSNPDELAEIGESLVQVYPISCGSGGQFEGSEVCDNIANSIQNGNTPTEVAKQFLQELKEENSN